MYNTCVHVQVYEMFDLDPASWVALIAQLVRASVRSKECRGFKSHLRQLIFHFFLLPQVHVPVFLSFFLSFHLKSSCISKAYSAVWSVEAFVHIQNIYTCNYTCMSSKLKIKNIDNNYQCF